MIRKIRVVNRADSSRSCKEEEEGAGKPCGWRLEIFPSVGAHTVDTSPPFIPALGLHCGTEHSLTMPRIPGDGEQLARYQASVPEGAARRATS